MIDRNELRSSIYIYIYKHIDLTWIERCYHHHREISREIKNHSSFIETHIYIYIYIYIYSKLNAFSIPNFPLFLHSLTESLSLSLSLTLCLTHTHFSLSLPLSLSLFFALYTLPYSHLFFSQSCFSLGVSS